MLEPILAMDARLLLRNRIGSENIGKADKTLFPEQGGHAHAAGHHRSEDGGQRRAFHAQRRESEVAADQQVVSDDVQHVGRHIGGHGDAGVAGAPLRRVDSQGNDVEHHAAHDDAEIDHRAFMSVGVGTAQPDDGIREGYAYGADHNAAQHHHRQRRRQRLIGPLLVLLPLPSGHNSGYRYVDRRKQGQADEFGLGGQAHRRHGIGAYGTDHQGVHHARQSNKKRIP